MNRRKFLATLGLTAVAAPAVSGASPAAPANAGDFDPSEHSIAELSRHQANQAISAESLTQSYLVRIEALDRNGPRLNSVLALNPDARAIARQLDLERRTGKLRGPLHGIPIILKDNIETRDPMPTTAGSLALAAARHSADSPLAARLRGAGAIILGKGNLSEWANFRSTRSVSGWSAVGGQTRNAYAGERDPSGSSAGPAVATAANLCAAAIGTETDGSVLAPASVNGIVGLKPTVGLVSAAGIVPISPRQDTAGPMTRTVADAALILSVIANPAVPWDAAVNRLEDRPSGLKLGVLPPPASAHPEIVRQSREWFELLKREGATLVEIDPPKEWSTLLEVEIEVLLYDFKAAINAYLARFNGRLPVRTLADLIDFNNRHARQEMPYFAQELFEQAEASGELTAPAYRKALAQLRQIADVGGLRAIFAQHGIDALVASGNGPAELIDPVWGDRYENSGGWPPMASAAAVAGYPSLTVPAGFVAGLPAGIAFVAPRFKDGLLLQIGRTFERASAARRPPQLAARS